MAFFFGLLSGSPKFGILVVPKLWTFISSSSQACLGHASAISYSPQKDLFNNLLHPLKVFVVQNQILNLTRDRFFNHNSCISGLNEQWKGTLSIYTARPFQWYLKGPILCFFAFSIKALNIWDSCMSATPKVGVHLKVIGFHLFLVNTFF
jgi:hypothetical protein